jgi:hypothetical protein
MAGKRTHIKVSTAEVIAIFHSYQKWFIMTWRKFAFYSETSSRALFKRRLWQDPGPMRGGFSRYIEPGPRSQGGAHESLKGPIALSIDVLFWFYLPFWWVFSTIFSLFRKRILENSLKLLNYGCWSSLTFTL